MWAAHSLFSGLLSLIQAFLSALHHSRSIAHGLRTWPSPLPSTILAHPTPVHSRAKGHIAQHTQHNSTDKASTL
jgi:hypothetical protein